MTSNVSRFTGNTSAAREHVTFAIADLAREYAKVWEVGYRAALNDADIDPLKRARMLSEQHAAYQIRVNLFEATIRAQLQARL